MRTPFQFTVYYLWKATIARENRRHNVHKHLAAVLCIIPNQNGGYEAEPQPLLGSLWGIP